VSKNRALLPADTVFCEGEAARSSALGLLRVRIYRRTVFKNNAASSEMLTGVAEAAVQSN
jgi:hypothetical protein